MLKNPLYPLENIRCIVKTIPSLKDHYKTTIFWDETIFSKIWYGTLIFGLIMMQQVLAPHLHNQNFNTVSFNPISDSHLIKLCMVCARILIWSNKMLAQKLSRSYLHSPSKLPFIGRTLGQQLYVMADKYTDKEMYVFYVDGERISFGQMKEKVRWDVITNPESFSDPKRYPKCDIRNMTWKIWNIFEYQMKSSVNSSWNL